MLGLTRARFLGALTFDQGVLVGWRGASQHTKFGPDFVDAFLLDLKVKPTGSSTSNTLSLLLKSFYVSSRR